MRRIGFGCVCRSWLVARGDIKPQNMMLTHSGLLVTIDFGTARQCGDDFAEGSPFGLDQPREAEHPLTSSAWVPR